MDVDVVIIGAGQAGLSVSYFLKDAGIDHLVIERGRIGESWRSQRWDSFHLNTPNWSNGLPGLRFNAENSDRFETHRELVTYLEGYADRFDLPVRENTEVTQLTRDDGDSFVVTTRAETIQSRAVVLASGGTSSPAVPAMARDLPETILSLSAGTYKNPGSLPEGAVVVVGTGQSGCQIAEDLLDAGRTVYICASRVARCPRRYRGRDILEWMRDVGIMEMTIEDLDDPSEQYAPQPQVSGTQGGHTVSLQLLASKGATLLGRVTGVQSSVLTLGDNLPDCISFADERSDFLKAAIDKWLALNGIDAPPPHDDPGEPPLPDLEGSHQRRELHLEDSGICAVIWCTGFAADWSWVKIDVFDGNGRPRHHLGITDQPGVYFVGLPWLSKRKSGILLGVAEDAERVAKHVRRFVVEAVA